MIQSTVTANVSQGGAVWTATALCVITTVEAVEHVIMALVCVSLVGQGRRVRDLNVQQAVRPTEPVTMVHVIVIKGGEIATA